MIDKKHQPVLLAEAVAELQIVPDDWYIDGTFGRGGHTQAILAQGGRVLAFDHDQIAIEYGQVAFSTEIASGHLLLVRENFDQLSQVAAKHLKVAPQGILFDFGTSVDQLTDSNRGFSFEGSGPLDMRMDTRLQVTAADLLAVLDERQLSELFRNEGGESEAKSIARAIVAHRTSTPIKTTDQLASLIEQTKKQRSKLHAATKVFQALRIAVNTELTNIVTVLPQALATVAAGGRIVTIAFHEGEDRAVKTAFRDWHNQGLGTNLTKKPITPSETELLENKRARSAKLRVFEKK